ncbi:ATP-binding protein [Streptomyces sp. 142MFCol3.1]|uniref:ATP-binding protein n=1 Tax=Streptomyces sp. 142MFCol3.1 TaxID=1172179 RepID=UPI00099863AD|nr:ATP-binding protein [Streptomyces sp. 142MFCol3.1]
MAPQAITFIATARWGRFARLRRRGPGDPLRTIAQDRGQGELSSPGDVPVSRADKRRALWSRTLEPLRPLDAPRARPSAWDASWPLQRDPTSVRRARKLVIAQLETWNMTEPADTAELLVSEVVTNALRHTRGPLRLNLQVRGSRLRCEVEDTDPSGPVRRFVDVDAEGGRGLELLDLLTDAWGTSDTATGKTMWFELRTHAEASTPMPSGEGPSASG